MYSLCLDRAWLIAVSGGGSGLIFPRKNEAKKGMYVLCNCEIKSQSSRLYVYIIEKSKANL
jgi:hypothetical protein